MFHPIKVETYKSKAAFATGICIIKFGLQSKISTKESSWVSFAEFVLVILAADPQENKLL